ncbi:MAG: class I SAM-dependent rRNA methyltransferase [Planctomycetota bacterium]|jgi:23S rRNA (cytosine1962-C5)-methyltransferase
MSQQESHRSRKQFLSPTLGDPIPSVTIQRPTLHPNIFRKRLLSIEGNPGPGDWVAIYGAEPENALFAYGIYNPKAEVAVRIYSWNARFPDEAYWDRQIDEAIDLRHRTLRLAEQTDAYRIVHGEADGFPGLVIDRYGNCLSAEAFSLGMYQRAEAVLERLHAKLGTQHHLIAPSPQFGSQEGATLPEIRSEACPDSISIQEHGVKYRVHFGAGHKTGFFCDQRDNRRILAEHSQGARVLDLCCYSGGFAIAAAKAGQASEVTAVDLDEKALTIAKKNAAINQVRVRFVHADAFAYMRDMLRNGVQYDIVVLDPPKLIRSRMELEEGQKKHYDLNRLAIQLVRPGGLLLTCSCAGLLSMEAFQSTVQSAARSGGYDDKGNRIPGRTVQVFEIRGAAPDHPLALHCPETAYLKAFWARVR